MTSHEFTTWAQSAALDWGYTVQLSGVGLSSCPSYYPSDHPHSPNAPIYASQVALFRLASGIPTRSPRSVRSSDLPYLSKEEAHPHKLVGRFVLPATVDLGSNILNGNGGIGEGGKGKDKAGVKEVREMVRHLLNTWSIGSVSLGELWGNEELAGILCKGSKRWLVGCLGGWGDQESIEPQDGESEFEVKWEKPTEGGRGLAVIWKSFTPTRDVRREGDDGIGMKDLPKREEPSERTGGW